MAKNCALGPGQISLLGSGAEKFSEVIKANDGSGSEFSELFCKFVTSGDEKTVGGLPQVLVATVGDVSIEPVLIGSDDGDAKIYHSGLEMAGDVAPST